MTKPVVNPGGVSAALTGTAPSGSAHSGMGGLLMRANCRSAIIETPEAGSAASERKRSNVVSDHAITAAAGSASYGYQTAAAAADVVR